jgi:hypothetical protein
MYGDDLARNIRGRSLAARTAEMPRAGHKPEENIQHPTLNAKMCSLHSMFDVSAIH